MAAVIWAGLGDADPVLNVGAGTGNYEPRDRRVVAIEPSTEMLGQRPPDAAPAIQGVAEALPFPDDSLRGDPLRADHPPLATARRRFVRAADAWRLGK